MKFHPTQVCGPLHPGLPSILLGFLFFGTISYVEDTIRGLIEGPSWQTNPVQFLVLDLSLVAGVDMSSAEAFVRMHRFLSAKSVTLVFCGFSAESTVGKALDSVQVLGADGVELFFTFNDAMECERTRILLRSERLYLLITRDRKRLFAHLVDVTKT